MPVRIFSDLSNKVNIDIELYNHQGVYIRSLKSQVQNIPISALYGHLRYVSTITECKNRLANEYAWQRQSILDLFGIYGY
jgi:hypothetical protein